MCEAVQLTDVETRECIKEEKQAERYAGHRWREQGTPLSFGRYNYHDRLLSLELIGGDFE